MQTGAASHWYLKYIRRERVRKVDGKIRDDYSAIVIAGRGTRKGSLESVKRLLGRDMLLLFACRHDLVVSQDLYDFDNKVEEERRCHEFVPLRNRDRNPVGSGLNRLCDVNWEVFAVDHARDLDVAGSDGEASSFGPDCVRNYPVNS